MVLVALLIVDRWNLKMISSEIFTPVEKYHSSVQIVLINNLAVRLNCHLWTWKHTLINVLLKKILQNLKVYFLIRSKIRATCISSLNVSLQFIYVAVQGATNAMSVESKLWDPPPKEETQVSEREEPPPNWELLMKYIDY